jgi:hypothetical protein
MKSNPLDSDSLNRTNKVKLKCSNCQQKWRAVFEEDNGAWIAVDESDACPQGCVDKEGYSIVGDEVLETKAFEQQWQKHIDTTSKDKKGFELD